MGKPVAGEVVVIPFRQSDLKAGKPRAFGSQPKMGALIP
jgi:hypothetical protein